MVKKNHKIITLIEHTLHHTWHTNNKLLALPLNKVLKCGFFPQPWTYSLMPWVMALTPCM